MAANKYKSVLAHFFTYLRGVPYNGHHVFTDEDLEVVTYDDVINYFKMRCFGTVDPDYNDQDLIVLCRVQSVEYWKKALSWFFVHFELPNVTQCKKMTDFLALIGRMETRGKGQPPHDVRPIEHSEFMHLVRLLKANDARSTIVHKYGLPALVSYQFSMICRIDDATQLVFGNLRRHDKFPTVALQSRLTWSKNVREQRSVPWQSLLGSINTTFCVLVNVGLWLEVNLGTTPGANLSPYVFAFSHDNNIPSGGIKSKQKASKIFNTIFSDRVFGDGNLGSHSIRKFAATHCRNNGMSTDDVNTRGRWKKSGVSDRYMDPNLPFVDIKACFSLCQGGTCTYVPKPDCLGDNFVCTYAAPNIVTKYNQDVAVVLGNAITWATFSSHADMVPEIIRNRILQAYNLLAEKLPDGVNPMERKTLMISGDVNTYRLAEIGAVADNNGPRDVGAGPVNLQNIAMLFTTQGNDMQRTMNEFTVTTNDKLEMVLTELRRVDGNVHQLQRTFTTNFNRMNRNPLRMLQQAAAANVNVAEPADANVVQQRVHAQPPRGVLNNDVAMNASLSPSPRTLHELWAEWQFGIGGRKPTRLFTEHESGVRQHKSTFSRRKAFWELMEYLIRSGYTHDDACARVYRVYGENQSVSSILNQIIAHRRHNTSPLMRY